MVLWTVEVLSTSRDVQVSLMFSCSLPCFHWATWILLIWDFIYFLRFFFSFNWSLAFSFLKDLLYLLCVDFYVCMWGWQVFLEAGDIGRSGAALRHGCNLTWWCLALNWHVLVTSEFCHQPLPVLLMLISQYTLTLESSPTTPHSLAARHFSEGWSCFPRKEISKCCCFLGLSET